MSVRILQGDCREVLRTLPDESVHMVCTSPPYFGLRDYGTAKWEGGDPWCDHLQNIGASKRSTLNGSLAHKDGRIGTPYGSECGKCGARRIDSQIGLEPTPDAYVAEMVAVFREVRRVLRKDGTVWLNLGDSYAGSWGNYGGQNRGNGSQREIVTGSKAHQQAYDGLEGWRPPTSNKIEGIKPKDLVGIPWAVAFALRADGWYLRQDIIWAKPNPMPESVRDRCTKAHEYLFLLTKSERYYYDADAIAEASTTLDPRRPYTSEGAKQLDGRAEWKSGQPRDGSDFSTRNRRSVWTITTTPFPEAHFAVFPPELPTLCIKAGTSEKGCCPECGAPWVRVVEREIVSQRQAEPERSSRGILNTTHSGRANYGLSDGFKQKSVNTLGWQPSCSCPEHQPVSCTILDPFGGSGTTGLVADRLQRNAILVELNPEYAAMARKRITGDAPLFAEAAE